MILCLCRSVSDHTVKAAISASAYIGDQIQRACGAGEDCGACRERHYGAAAAVH